MGEFTSPSPTMDTIDSLLLKLLDALEVDEYAHDLVVTPNKYFGIEMHRNMK